MSKIDWKSLISTAPPITVTGRIWRVVESQQQVATATLVDDLAEQALLEDMLETSKPKGLPGSERLHYLLKTPFRYPPLHWGSRFGNRFEPGIFYAAHVHRTALAETAFYRLLFFEGMQEPPTKLISQHVMFAVRSHSQHGIKLQQAPFHRYTAELTDKSSYSESQALGSQLREQGYQIIEFISARDLQSGINLAVLTPLALRSRQPEKSFGVLAQTTGDGVSFKLEGELWEFPAEQFWVDGNLPHPA